MTQDQTCSSQWFYKNLICRPPLYFNFSEVVRTIKYFTCLNAVLKEDSTTLDMIDNIILYKYIMCIMYIYSSIKCPVDAAAFHIWLILVSIKMKVNWISAKSERLSCKRIHEVENNAVLKKLLHFFNNLLKF